ncbi:MAG: two-component system LytT family response regulator [Oceanicoccus sp.]|jgi:two-component system LytT family response regulator
MLKLRTIIVDDEPLARKLLRTLLTENEAIEVVAECNNGREAIKMTHQLSPDLLFLDIEMPGSSGFEVIKALQSDIMPMVIFSTAYQRYALDAFDLHAVDYLLKPVDEQRLERAVLRAQARFQKDNSDGQNKTALLGAIDEISKKIASNSIANSIPTVLGQAGDNSNKIAIKDNDSTVLVDIDDIDWIDAAGDYMCVHVSGVTHVMRSTLKALMAKLDPDNFKRIHRSTVVNLARISKVTSQDKGEYILDLDCDEQLKVSRNYRDSIKVFLAQKK